MLKVFIGYDPRQPIAYNVCAHSVVSRSTEPVSITRLQLSQLPITRKGLTEFTFSRFLVPWLCEFKGTALFLDSDMLCLDDIAELFRLKDETPIQVVKNEQKFEWPSLMLFDCAQCWKLTPEAVEGAQNLFDMESWTEVGDLPAEWNHCVGYDNPSGDARLVHYTQGVPVWPQTENCEYAQDWHEERKWMMSTVSWEGLMGNSVHTKRMGEK